MKIHFIGIGGIGVSALARYYLAQGNFITGSDLAQSEITDHLAKLGAKIIIGPHSSCDKPGLSQGRDRVIYSPAIENNNPELKQAKKLGIKCQSYPEALGELTKKYFTIAVCGTHGKGTTTAMISLIMIKAGLDPTVIIGTKLKEFGNSNFRKGESKYLVIEADEYKSSFLNYQPKIIVITCIDKDHLDYFKNLGNIVKAFKKFIGHLPQNGTLIADKNDLNTQKAIKTKHTTFSTIARNVVYSSDKNKTTIKKLRQILKLPGQHILADALAALTVAQTLKIPDKTSFKALSEYKGAWRRFEQKKLKINSKTIYLINDYGHHPTEIAVTLKAVREKYPDKKITCVFQPHQYQRTFYLFKDFVKVLSQAEIDSLILTDIYSVSGRESAELKKKVSSAKLAKQVKNRKVIHLKDNLQAAKYLKKNLTENEVLVIMGAGNVYDLEKLLTLSSRKGRII